MVLGAGKEETLLERKRTLREPGLAAAAPNGPLGHWFWKD
jgi:hypothetical protein